MVYNLFWLMCWCSRGLHGDPQLGEQCRMLSDHSVALKCQASITQGSCTTSQKNGDLIHGTTLVLVVSMNHTRENFCMDFFAVCIFCQQSKTILTD